MHNPKMNKYQTGLTNQQTVQHNQQPNATNKPTTQRNQQTNNRTQPIQQTNIPTTIIMIMSSSKQRMNINNKITKDDTIISD